MSQARKMRVKRAPAGIMPKQHQGLMRLHFFSANPQNRLGARMIEISCVIDRLRARYRANEVHGGFSRALGVGTPDNIRGETAGRQRCTYRRSRAASAIIERAFMVALVAIAPRGFGMSHEK